jgi:23S rRNA (adenine2030-N6)-methyltransferase
VIVKAWRKWATGVYMLWHPIKDRRAVAAFAGALAASGTPKILRAELAVGASAGELGAAGLVLINPPWRLAEELKILLDPLARVLVRGSGGGYRLDWLRGEA